LAVAVRSETIVLVPMDDVEVVDDEASGAVVCERRLDAVLRAGVRVVEDVVEVSEDVVEVRRLDEVTVCTGCKAHFGPGQLGPEEMEEAEHVTPRRRADAKAR